MAPSTDEENAAGQPQDMAFDAFKCLEVLNLTDEGDVEVYGYSWSETIFVTVCLPLILTLGILDNSAFIYVVYRVPCMQTSINCYLVNLAVADIVFLSAGIGEKISRFRGSPIHGDDNPLGKGGCVWVYLIMDTAYFASLCFVSLVSVDRYFAVCKPRLKNVHRKSKTTLLTAGSWVASLCLSSALIPSSTKLLQVCFTFSSTSSYSNWPPTWGICAPAEPWMKAYANGMQAVPFFFALVVNVIMFVLIVRSLSQSIERLQAHTEIRPDVDTQVRDRVARMLVINGVAFFVCLSPFEIISFSDMIATLHGDEYHLSSDAQARFVFFSRSLAYINCVINPIIYTAMSHRYRHAFRQAFRTGESPSPVRHSANTATNEFMRLSLDTRV